MATRDSRLSALTLYKSLRLNVLLNTSTFIGNLCLALLLTYFFRQLGYGTPIDYVFFIGALSIGLWVSEAIPPFAVAILIIVLLLFGFGTDFFMPHTGGAVQLYLGTWTSNVIWLLLGGFFLAAAMKEVGLDLSLFRFTVTRFGTSPKRFLFGMMLVTAIGSMIMSNSATTAMMISSILPLLQRLGKESPYTKALLISIPAAASVGGIGTIIGSTPNSIAVGALSEISVTVTFVLWMAIGLPIALVLIYLFYRYISYTFHLDQLSLDFNGLVTTEGVIDIRLQRIVLGTLIITVGLWLTEPLHGIPVAGTSAVPILFLTITRVIDSDKVRSLPWDTLILVAGGLALGIAMTEVGLAQLVMAKVNSLPFGPLVVVIVFSFVAVTLSNVMSNTAAASILIPLTITLPTPYCVAAPLIVAMSCSTALLLPVSTPPNAIAFSTGLIDQSDFRKGGVFFMLAGPVISTILVFLFLFLVV